MNTGFRIFLACTIGAFIGALIALQLHIGVLSGLIGAAVGFIVGYLTYNAKELATAVHRASRVVYNQDKKIPWRKIIKQVFILIGLASLCLTNIAIDRIADPKLPFIRLLAIEGFWAWFKISFFLEIFSELNFFNQKPFLVIKSWQKNYPWIWRAFLISPIFLCVVGPAVLTFSALYGIVYLCPLILKIILSGIKKSPKLFRLIFVYIHSDIRLLCGTDAAIGAAIGFYTGNALIGALAGGILGVINYQLVSIRWLKLVPTTK